MIVKDLKVLGSLEVDDFKTFEENITSANGSEVIFGPVVVVSSLSLVVTCEGLAVTVDL